MTTPKQSFSLEFAIFEAMQPPPAGLGAQAVSAILRKSRDVLYKATNPNSDAASAWGICVDDIINLSAALAAAGLPDHVMHARLNERNVRAERIIEHEDIDRATAKMLHSVSAAVLHLTAARDPDSDHGEEISDEEARLIMSALDEAQTAIKQKQQAVMATVSKRKIARA